MASEIVVDHREKALALLKRDADKILKLIQVQMDNLTMPQCPLYEEVLDTQIRFGIGIFGPSLDEKGNSIAGIRLLELLSANYSLSIF
ncbi:DUF1507 family protein [Bacillus licheniformis]|nr:DUF1507 family protein [Bacillus licheniformis]